jgi:hypothetical protein
MAALFGVIAERPGVIVTEIAGVTGIAKPLICNTTRACSERGELEPVTLSGGGRRGFKMVPAAAPASEPATPPGPRAAADQTPKPGLKLPDSWPDSSRAATDLEASGALRTSVVRVVEATTFRI